MAIISYPNSDNIAKVLQVGPLTVIKKPFVLDGCVVPGCVATSSETATSRSR